MAQTITVHQAGNTLATNPYTIAIVANPVLAKLNGNLEADPITATEQLFQSRVRYVLNCLFGRLPEQAEKLLAEPDLGPNIKVVSLFDDSLPIDMSNSLVNEFAGEIAEPIRKLFTPFLARFGIQADVAFAITASPTHVRASAYHATEDQARGGIDFESNGSQFKHWFYSLVPGTIALPSIASSLTALHEFGHAFSSYTDDMLVTDQYVDSPTALNVKQGRPIPGSFGTFASQNYATDPNRGGLGYPPTWTSYHPELFDATVPSLMDDYWQVPQGRKPEHCMFDKVTRNFIRDRLLAKFARG